MAGPSGPATGTPPTSSPTASGNPTDPAYITQQLQALYGSLGKTPTGPGSGPTDIAYYAQQIANTGGWTGGNISYWQNRIASDVKGGSGTQTAATSTVPGATAGFTPPSSVAQYMAMTPSPYTNPATPTAYVPPASVDQYLKLHPGGAA